MTNRLLQSFRTIVLTSLIAVVLSLPESVLAGSIVCWGLGNRGQTSNPAGSDFAAIAAGGEHSLALRDDGTIVSWGGDTSGQVSDTPEGSLFTAISAGSGHSFALRNDGTIVSWGHDSGGKVSDTPTENGFTAIAAGSNHSHALRADGTIVSWGHDNSGVVSDTPTSSGFTAIATGSNHSLALRADGTIVAWGHDYFGQVGDTPTDGGYTSIAAGQYQSYALGVNGAIVSWGQVSGDPPTDSGYIDIGSSYGYGSYHSVALSADGAIVSWGSSNYHRQLSDTPTENGFIAVAAGSYHSLALASQPETPVDSEVDLGTLRIILSPQDAIHDGAKWRVDNGGWQDSGTMVTDLLVGVHSIEFKAIPGWTSPYVPDVGQPTNLVVDIRPNQTTQSSGTYSRIWLDQVYVSTAGNDATGDGSADYPFQSIQKAIDTAADPGGVVMVLPGTYAGQGNYALEYYGKAITVRSIDPHDPNVVAATIIDCDWDVGFYFYDEEGTDSVLAGLTIIKGGIECDGSSPTIRDCVISDSEYSGISCRDGSNPVISHCRIIGNWSDESGGGIVCVDSSPNINNCVISGNEARYDGGGIAVYGASRPIITNCTITENTARYDGGAILVAGHSNTMISNCVLWDNAAEAGKELYLSYYSWPGDAASTIGIGYSNIEGGYAGSFVEGASLLLWGDGNIDVDPAFANAQLDDYNLLEGSPCIDGGNNDAIGDADTDLANNPRVINGMVDIGAYEYQEARIQNRGMLFVDTSPVKGEVFVNGDSWGIAPQSREVEIGEHAVSLGHVDGYGMPEVQIAHVQTDQETHLSGIYVPVLPDMIPDTISISKLVVKAGKVRSLSSDAITISGSSLDATASAFSLGNTITIRILNGNNDTAVFSDTIHVLAGKYKNGKFNYKGPKGRITSLKCDLNKNTFAITAKNIDLTGLRSPVVVDIEIGDYAGTGTAYDNEVLALGNTLDVINGKKPMPMQLQSGVEDRLRVDKCKFKLGAKPSSDRLTIQGALAVEDISISMGGEDVLVSWGDYDISLPANDLYAIGSKNAFKYKKPKGSSSSIGAAIFDLEKCTFKIVIKKAHLGSQNNPIDFTIQFADFSKTVTLQLTEKKLNDWRFP